MSDFRWLSRHGILCFGGEDWWYHNRGHADMQYVRQLARLAPVLYVNSIVMRKPNIGEGRIFFRRVSRKARSMARGLVRVPEGFRVYSPLSLPMHHVAPLRVANAWALRAQVEWAARRTGLRRPVVWVNCPAACDVALALRRSALVYQRTDRYEEYPGVDAAQIRRYDRRLKQAAQLTFFSNRRLYEDEASECCKAAYAEHGVDYERFSTAGKDPWIPPEMRSLKRPIAGFYGAIDAHTFDMQLMADVVERLPNTTFVFIGNASADCAPLVRHANVVRIAQRPYEQIPHYAKCFDVCLMPWCQNRWIDACNPIKMKEYSVLGKPIVSTPFSELARLHANVRIAATASLFAAKVREAVADNGAAHASAARPRQYASWSDQLGRILALTLAQPRAR